MTNQRCNLARLAPLAAVVAILGTACGPTTTESSSTVTAPATDLTALTIAEPDTTPPPSTTSTIPDDTTTTAAPSPSAPPSLPCGEFGPIPPRPDSMPTKFFDTNGDGEPDAVTAYGSPAGFVLRVVENGITSEAALDPQPEGWAYISGSATVGGREHVTVQDKETGAVHTFATNSSGCVELISTSVSTACGTFGPIPTTYPIVSDLAVDLTGDGTATDRVIAYFDQSADVYKLRSIRSGVTSEIAVLDVGVSSPRVLGVGDAGAFSSGNEVIVRTGGGLQTATIGMYGHDDRGCLFEFTLYGAPLALFVDGSTASPSGVYCDTGLIATWEYSLEADGTYIGSSAAYFESSPGDFTYLGGSDDFSEGLSAADLSPSTLDCFGFGL